MQQDPLRILSVSERERVAAKTVKIGNLGRRRQRQRNRGGDARKAGRKLSSQTTVGS